MTDLRIPPPFPSPRRWTAEPEEEARWEDAGQKIQKLFAESEARKRELEEAVVILRAEIEPLNAKIIKLNDDTTSMAGKIVTLQENVTELKDKVAGLQSSLGVVRQKQESLEREMYYIREMQTLTRQTQVTQSAQISDLNTRVMALESP